VICSLRERFIFNPQGVAMNRITSTLVVWVLGTIGFALAPSAHAQWMLKQDTGLYLGAAIGQAKVRNFCSEAAAAGFTSCDEKDIAWKVSAGYHFHRNFAVEAGYVDWGKFTVGTAAGTGTVKARGFELLGVAAFPVYRDLSAYGKVGFVRWDADFSVAVGGTTFATDDKGTELTFGLGLAYDFTNNLAARLEWQRYTDLVVDMVSLGLIYKFR
jgi:OOP family OmpA-OmpF porin